MIFMILLLSVLLISCAPVSSGNVKYNDVTPVYYLSVEEFEDFVNSINDDKIYKIVLSGDYEEFKTHTAVLKNKQKKIDLDISSLKNATSIGGSEDVQNTNLPRGEFNNCYSLIRLVLPNTITRIEKAAFYCCDYIECIEIPETVTYIGPSAFVWCGNLEKLTWPKNLKRYEEYVFAMCRKLIITIPDDVEYVGAGAFECVKLKNCIIPEGQKRLGGNTFSNTDIEIANLPDSIDDIGIYEFSGCKSLKELKLSSNLVRICDYAFMGDDAIKTITIPKSVKDIYLMAFYGCNFETVYFERTIGWKVRMSQSSDIEIDANELKDPYKAAELVKQYEGGSWYNNFRE